MTSWSQISSPPQAFLSHVLAQGPPANDCTTLRKITDPRKCRAVAPWSPLSLSLPTPLRVSTSGLYIHHSSPSFQDSLFLLFTCLPDSPSFEIHVFLGQSNASHDSWCFNAWFFKASVYSVNRYLLVRFQHQVTEKPSSMGFSHSKMVGSYF